MKKQRGFSLIELLIVVAVIGIIAAIAVPNLMKSREAAQEASAISSLRTLATAQITFAATQGNGKFAPLLTDLGPTGASLIDEALESGSKEGYTFALATANADETFTITADPIVETDPRRHFFVDETAVIRFELGAGATVASDPLGKVN